MIGLLKMFGILRIVGMLKMFRILRIVGLLKMFGILRIVGLLRASTPDGTWWVSRPLARRARVESA